MKTFRCGDVVPGCSQTFEGASEAEVLLAVGEHARRDHGLELDDDTLEAVRARVRSS